MNIANVPLNSNTRSVAPARASVTVCLLQLVDRPLTLFVQTTWLPDGTWYDAVSGALITAASGGATFLTRSYALSEVPFFVRAGAVVPYIPLRSMPTIIGLASRQYTFLGFRIYPGATGAVSGEAYEDDGATTGYLSGAYMRTTCTSTLATDGSGSITVASAGAGYPEFPATRAYQFRLLNGVPPSSVTVNGVTVPFVRFGSLAAKRTTPPSHQWYYDMSAGGEGIAVVIDVVGLSTSAPVTVTLGPTKTGVLTSDMSGVYGAVSRAIAAKVNTDLDRTTPGANTVMPSYTSILASTGEALSYLAGTTDFAAFVAAVQAVPQLLVNGTSEMGADKSPRVPYSVALLETAI